MHIRISGATAESFAKRAFKLLYDACGLPLGMGALQAMRLDGREATEEEIWKCAYNEEDYPCGRTVRNPPPGEVYGDYVFGRMMKWGCTFNGDVIEVSDFPFKANYQGFARTYPDNTAIFDAVADSLGCQYQHISDVQKGGSYVTQ
jgi:hypothetical protein